MVWTSSTVALEKTFVVNSLAEGDESLLYCLGRGWRPPMFMLGRVLALAKLRTDWRSYSIGLGYVTSSDCWSKSEDFLRFR